MRGQCTIPFIAGYDGWRFFDCARAQGRQQWVSDIRLLAVEIAQSLPDPEHPGQDEDHQYSRQECDWEPPAAPLFLRVPGRVQILHGRSPLFPGSYVATTIFPA